MSLRESKRAETERRILAAARRAFLQEGVDGASMTGIASEAGVSRATLFNYFAGKPALLGALAASLETRLAGTVAHYRSREPDAAEALMALFGRAAAVLEQTAALTRLLLVHCGSEQGFPSLLAEFRLLVQTGQASGQWRRDIDAEAMADALHQAFLASLLGWCRRPELSLAEEFRSRAAALARLLAAPV